MILGVNKILSDRKNVFVFTQQKQFEYKPSQEEFENIAMTHSNFVFQIFCSDQIIGSNTENMNNSILNYLEQMKFSNRDSVFLIGNPELISSLTGYFTDAENKPKKK